MQRKSRQKIRPPAYQMALVPRQRLYSLLDEHANKPLLLIVAPAGFGKTCLVAQWLQSAPLSAAAKVWINLDRDDQDPRQFLPCLLLALQDAGVELGGLTPAAGRDFVDTPPRLLVDSLAEKLGRSQRGVIVLDNYHLADEAGLNEVMEQLIQSLPEQWQLVIASRVRPGICVSSLRLHGLIGELDDRELAFTPEEISAFFAHEITAEQGRDILAKTAAWPAALQLVKLCAQHSGRSPPPFT